MLYCVLLTKVTSTPPVALPYRTNGGRALSDQWGKFQQKFQNRVSNLGKISRTGMSKAYDFPEQVKFIVKGLV